VNEESSRPSCANPRPRILRARCLDLATTGTVQTTEYSSTCTGTLMIEFVVFLAKNLAYRMKNIFMHGIYHHACHEKHELSCFVTTLSPYGALSKVRTSFLCTIALIFKRIEISLYLNRS
jgi:hypothetical protein